MRNLFAQTFKKSHTACLFFTGTIFHDPIRGVIKCSAATTLKSLLVTLENLEQCFKVILNKNMYPNQFCAHLLI